MTLATATQRINNLAPYYKIDWFYIPGYNDAYSVKTNGTVWSRWRKFGWDWVLVDDWQPLTPGVVQGYLQVVLYLNGCRDMRKVHQLVAEAVYGPPPPGMEVCHGDGNRSNNWSWNLRHGTKTSNQSDRVLHGTDNCGERNGNAIYDWSIVQQMRADWATDMYTYKTLGDKYCTDFASIARIVKNEAWIDPTYQVPSRPSLEERRLNGTIPDHRGQENPNSIMTWEKVGQLRADWQTRTYTQRQLATKYGLAPGSISAIVNNKQWIV